MTVTANDGSDRSVANGVTTVFAYGFKIDDDDDIAVYVDDVLKTKTTHYTVSGVGGAGGSITFLVAPANLAVVTRIRKETVSQETNYVANELYSPVQVGRDFDKRAKIEQMLAEKLARALKFGVDSAQADVVVPEPEDGMLLGWDGTDLVNTPGELGPTGLTGPQGATGPTGPTGPAGTAGVGITWRGAWSAIVTYALYDSVTLNGTSYVSNVGSNLNHTPPNVSFWDVLVAKGDTGATGAAGTSDHAALSNLTSGDPHTQYQLKTGKGAASGYAGLGSDSLVPTAQLGTGTANSTTFLRGDRSYAAFSPGAASIDQASLKTTTGAVSSAISANIVMPGGSYGFYPQLKQTAPVSGTATMRVANSSLGSTYTTIIAVNASATSGGKGGGVDYDGVMFAQQRYVQASPPYDLGDGAILLFVFALVEKSTGKVVATYTAPEAPWHNNGPTRIGADFVNDKGVAFQRIKPVIFSIARGLKIEPDAMLERLAEPNRAIELTQAIKNADMNLIPHPFVRSRKITPERYAVVLLDPVDSLMVKLAELDSYGAPENTATLLHAGKIKFGNDRLKRAGPPGVDIVSVKL